MNTEKTEWTTLKRGKEKKDETWRTTKKLGTLLGDREESLRRKQLAAAAFNNLRRIWSRKRNKIKKQRNAGCSTTPTFPQFSYIMLALGP